MTIDNEIEPLLSTYRSKIVGTYWPPESRFVAENYRTIPFPLTAEPAPGMIMEIVWNLSEVLGYMKSWSATQRCALATGTNPLTIIEPDLRKVWGNPEKTRIIRWPLTIRVGKP
jgi:hypothetical protein